jgi:hypothetical protein
MTNRDSKPKVASTNASPPAPNAAHAKPALKPFKVSYFESLNQVEMESLLLRARCGLTDIQKAYTQLLSKPLTPQSVLQFALDPWGFSQPVDPRNWAVMPDGNGQIVLYENKAPFNMDFVHDKPTYRLFEIILQDYTTFPWKERFHDNLTDDTGFTVKEITMRFDIPGSTVHTWIQHGKPEAALPPLPSDKNEQGQRFCRYGDLKQFLPYSRKSRPSRKK